MIARHGDVIFRKVSELPKDAEQVFEGPSYVVAEGEVTGHKHTLNAEAVSQKILDEVAKITVHVEQDEMMPPTDARWTPGMSSPEPVRYIKIDRPLKLTHQEHNTITLEPGIYKVEQEQEFDFFQHDARTVFD